MAEIMPKQTSAPELNYEIEAFIDISAAGTETPEWATIGTFIKNISQALNEVLYQATYYADAGWGSTEVTGGQFTATMTGDVKREEPACAWLMDEARQYGFGEIRKTFLRLVRGNTSIIWPVTVANITDGMGDANQPNALSLTVHGNGKPTVNTVTPEEPGV